MNNSEMNSSVRQVIAFAATIAILWVAYYGNYLPLKKSQAFIEATRMMGSVRSFDQFIQVMSVPLEVPSPIGQEELVRNLSSVVTDVLKSPSGRDPRLTAAIMEYLHKYYDPIIARGRGMSFQQDLYIMGLANQVAFSQTSNQQYYLDAEQYLLTANRLAPFRPQPLYGLFDLYRSVGNAEKATEAGVQILKLWPSDAQVRLMLAAIIRAEEAKKPR